MTCHFVSSVPFGDAINAKCFECPFVKNVSPSKRFSIETKRNGPCSPRAKDLMLSVIQIHVTSFKRLTQGCKYSLNDEGELINNCKLSGCLKNLKTLCQIRIMLTVATTLVSFYHSLAVILCFTKTSFK